MNAEKIRVLIQNDEVHKFYESKEWRRLRKKILSKHKTECQICKKKGKYTKATHVHHEKHVRKYPELALSEMYYDYVSEEEKENLISVCRQCHETECHPERFVKEIVELTEERWE